MTQEDFSARPTGTPGVMIEYPSWTICEAKAREFSAFERKPEQVQARAAKQITIKIWPRCSKEFPQIWIIDGARL